MLTIHIGMWASAVLAGLAVGLLGLAAQQVVWLLWQHADPDRALAWRRRVALGAESSARRRAAGARVGLVEPELLAVRQSWPALSGQGRARPYLGALTAGVVGLASGATLLTTPEAASLRHTAVSLTVFVGGLAGLLWAVLAARRPLLRIYGTRLLAVTPAAPRGLTIPLAAIGASELRGGGRWLVLHFNQPTPFALAAAPGMAPHLVLDLSLAEPAQAVAAAELLQRLPRARRGECRDD